MLTARSWYLFSTCRLDVIDVAHSNHLELGLGNFCRQNKYRAGEWFQMLSVVYTFT